MATCTEMVLFFPNTLFKKKLMEEQSQSNRGPVANQSPISCLPVSDHSQTIRRLVTIGRLLF